MDKLEKALAKLASKEREQVNAILQEIQAGHFKKLNIKKLKGRDDVFRVRKGNLRIIYRMDGMAIFVLAIERRNEGTYKL